MSKNLRKCLKELKIAMKYGNPKRQHILEFLSNRNCIYNALREISMNIQKLKLKNHHARKLEPHIKTIKALQVGTKSKIRRRRLVKQSGGFLPWLIPLVASALPAVIDLIKK